MKYVDIRDLPPCSFSPQCLRLLDELDMPTAAPAPTRLAYIEDLQDERHLRQLRSHIPSCPTCSALLVEARRMRAQQRLMFYHFMLANERQVPATSGAIFEAIRRENMMAEEKAAFKLESSVQEQYMPRRALASQDATLASSPLPLHSHTPQRRHLFQNVLTLATVAAVILAAVGLLNRFTAQSGTTSSQPARTSLPNQSLQPGLTTNNDGWNSVLFGLTMLSAAGMVQSLAFYNYDTSSDHMTLLVSSTRTFDSINMEGISGNGQTLLYDETSTGQQRSYKTLSTLTSIHTVYQIGANQGGNAVWMDTTHFLVQNSNGKIQEVNVQTGVSQQTWPLETGALTFYHQPFLYFVGAASLETGALYRANLSQPNPTPQRITNPSPDTRFWLSIDGATVFYANRGSSGVQGIYAVGSGGTNLRLLRPGTGIPIGYASDNALMVMDQVQGKFQVIKLGTLPSAPEKVILSDAAPGAVSFCDLPGPVGIISMCDQHIALAPYGHGLLLNARYANGTSSLVYDNLDTGASHIIRTLPAGTNVQLPGWSKMSFTNQASPAFGSQAA
ncbi:MAG TPA: hypothetical protein VGM01_02295 [Ktedonobacteraceae bacterium]